MRECSCLEISPSMKNFYGKLSSLETLMMERLYLNNLSSSLKNFLTEEFLINDVLI